MQMEFRIYLKDEQIIWTKPLSQKLAFELTIRSFEKFIGHVPRFKTIFLIAVQFAFERLLRFSFLIKRLSF